MSKILVIGGTRFLGLEITRLMAKERPEDVYVLNRGVTEAVLPDGVGRIPADLNDIPGLISTLKSMEPEVVIDTILQSDMLAHILPTLGGRLKRFIHTGSIGVYGSTRYLPTREGDEASPQFGFDEKLAQDEVVLEHARKHGLPATSLRMSYIYGRGDIPLELWGGRNPEFFRRLQKGEEFDVPGDGKTLLHPGHVTDLARPFLLCLENDACVGQAYNIGGERSITLANYLQVICEAMGVEPLVRWKPADEVIDPLVEEGLADRYGMLFLMEHMSVDISKAKAQLGYSPSISLEEGMKDNIDWMRERGIIE